MKKICLISTGGTIASEAGENGLRPQITGADMIAMIPSLQGVCDIEYKEISQLDSSNLAPEHWRLMARTVMENYAAYDGFVISHGTDTMAYSSAALHYMLAGIEKPVIFTGSQLPIGHPRTDGKDNLAAAFLAAVTSRPGVYLAFHGRLIEGNAAKKLYTEDFDGFRSINCPDAGYVKSGAVVWLRERRAAKTPLCLRCELDTNVFVLKLIPGLNPDILVKLVDWGCRAIIIEGFGAGGVPTGAGNFLPGVDYAQKHGVAVICATQAVYEGVHLERYEMGVLAARHGVIDGGALTTEALVAKTMLALARAKNIEEIRAFITAQTE